MADITMSLDDTLELDAVIEEWSNPDSVITDSENKFDMSGFHTSTGVLDPQEPGTHNIKVNGQELTVEVIDNSKIPESIIHQYQFEDNSDGSVAIDSIGDKDANINNNISYNTESIQGSLSIEVPGTGTDYVKQPDKIDFASIGSDNSFGFGGYVYTTDTGGSFIGSINDDDNNNHVAIENEGGYWNVFVQLSASNDNNISSAAVKQNQWQHIWVNGFNGNKVEMYVDGSKVLSDSGTFDYTSIGSGPMWIGARRRMVSNGFTTYPGYFDNWAYSNVRLSKDEVQLLL